MATASPDPALQGRADWGQLLFQASSDLALIHDDAGAILDANPVACRCLGYTREELLQRPVREVHVPEPAPTFLPRRVEGPAQVRRGGEGTFHTRDGRLLAVETRSVAVCYQGRPATVILARDLSQQRQLEEALGKQGQLLQSILDSMDNAIVVADSQHHVFLFNQLAERLLGPGLLQGTFYLYETDRVTPLPEFPLDRCVRGESFNDREVFVRHAEAPHGLWLSMTGRPLREHDGTIKGGVLVCQDITRRHRAERRLKAQYEVARLLAEGEELHASVRRVLAVLCSALDLDVGLLWHTDASGTRLHLLESWSQPGLSLDQLLTLSRTAAFAAGEELPGQVWQERQHAAFTATDAPWAALPRWSAASAVSLEYVLGFPVGIGPATTGVLEFWSRSLEETDDALVSMMQAIGNQLGQFLEHQRVEKELRDSQALYQSLVQSLPQNIFRKDRDGRVTFANQRYCVSLRQPLEALLGKTDFDLFPHELAAKYVSDDRQIMATGQPLDTTERHHLPDGSTIYVHVVKTPVYDAQNRIIGVQGIFWDVTEQVLAAENLGRSEKRYRQLTEATMDGIVVVNERGRITLLNPAAERLFGYQAGEVLGEPAGRLVPQLFRPLEEEGLEAYLRRHRDEFVGRTGEFQGRRKDGGLVAVEIALSVLSEGDEEDGERKKARILAAIRDLSERNKMRAVLVQNEKLAMIGLLSAGVAHEINNPLAFVANNLVVLERDVKSLMALLELYELAQGALARVEPDVSARIATLKEEQDLPYVQENLGRLLQRTREGVDRITRIVHHLRVMARTETPRRQETRLPDLFTSNIEILHGRYKQLGVVIEQKHEPELVVPCDPTQISQVILNLLVNAFQAIESTKREGGRIAIRTERQHEELLVEIADNGCGVQPENLSRLFDPFFTTKEVGEGTGLGLSITHQLVTAHGGRIDVDSQPGQGSCFRVYLPLRERRNRA
jgi:PAS domain S-box-containing protein